MVHYNLHETILWTQIYELMIHGNRNFKDENPASDLLIHYQAFAAQKTSGNLFKKK